MLPKNFLFDEILIKSKLKTYNSPNRLSMHHKSFINSAVNFLIIPYNNKPYEIVMIRRTKRKNDKHSGEMSFPGGKFDTHVDKNYLDTALRETEEELGISRSNLSFLGCLDDHLTPKGFIITPFVSYLKNNQKMVKQDEEVDEIIKIPITYFADKNAYQERTYYIKKELIGVGKYKYKAPNGKKYVIFGATSHIIQHYIDIIYNIGLITPGCRRINCEDIKDRIINNI